MLKDVLKKELRNLEVTEDEFAGLEEELAKGCGAGVDNGNGTCGGDCGNSPKPIS